MPNYRANILFETIDEPKKGYWSGTKIIEADNFQDALGLVDPQLKDAWKEIQQMVYANNE